jgi:hypothetical protein
MTWELHTPWQPTSLLRIGESCDTSTGATEVLTDAGRAYVKPLGNRQGPHVLATDWVGTHLAKWFGLSTFDIAILGLGESDLFPLPRDCHAAVGAALASRAVDGFPWGKSTEELDELVNPEDITRLVVFDTWTLNCDRHFPDPKIRKPNFDNVFFSTEDVAEGRLRLLAIDYGLCFIRSGEDLTTRVSHIEKIQDERIYGLFPQFEGRLSAATVDECMKRLRSVTTELASRIVETIPKDWEVDAVSRAALVELISRRGQFVADNFEGWIERKCPWFGQMGG